MSNAKFNRTIGFTIQIFPNLEQQYIFDKYFGVSRYIYNWTIDKEKEEYESNSGFLSAYSLYKILSDEKKDKDWLNEFDGTSLKLRISDGIRAYKRFFDRKTKYPRYKSKKDSTQMFCVRSDRLRIREGIIRIPSIGWIKCGNLPDKNIIGDHAQCADNSVSLRWYYDARIHKNGNNYYLSFTMDIDETPEVNFKSLTKYPRKIFHNSKSIGIDLGCKGRNWIVDSNGIKVSLPVMEKENKKIKRFQKILSRKLRARTKHNDISNNAKKIINKINNYYRRKTNKRRAVMYDYISHNILAKNPESVVIEDIVVSELLKTKKDGLSNKRRADFNQRIFDSALYEFRTVLEYKTRVHNIPLVIADKFYPSTQICSVCGSRNKIGTRTVYKCEHCGNTMDRDLNAACNLSNYNQLEYSIS